MSDVPRVVSGNQFLISEDCLLARPWLVGPFWVTDEG